MVREFSEWSLIGLKHLSKMFELSKWYFLDIFEGVEICIRIKRLSSISTRFLELYRWFSIVGDSLSMFCLSWQDLLDPVFWLNFCGVVTESDRSLRFCGIWWTIFRDKLIKFILVFIKQHSRIRVAQWKHDGSYSRIGAPDSLEIWVLFWIRGFLQEIHFGSGDVIVLYLFISRKSSCLKTSDICSRVCMVDFDWPRSWGSPGSSWEICGYECWIFLFLLRDLWIWVLDFSVFSWELSVWSTWLNFQFGWLEFVLFPRISEGVRVWLSLVLDPVVLRDLRIDQDLPVVLYSV
jgi:hypothetical protein